MYLILNKTILPYSNNSVKRKEIIYLSIKEKNEDILKIIAKVIEKNKIDVKKIKGIIIAVSDNISFTSLRIIITIVNIFGKFFNLPISLVKENEVKTIEEILKIGKKRLKKKIILPTYYKEPNITIKTRS